VRHEKAFWVNFGDLGDVLRENGLMGKLGELLYLSRSCIGNEILTIICLACVLVGPCLTHLETEGFSLFVAFEYFVREEFNVRCAIIVPTDTNCGTPQSLILPGAVNSNEIPFVQQPDHRDPLFGLPVLRARRLSS
jgi:hypothetical protein